MATWEPGDVFDIKDGALYCYYQGDGMTLTTDQADALAEYLSEWAQAKRDAANVESVPEWEWPEGLERDMSIRTTIAGLPDRYGVLRDVTRRVGSSDFSLVIDAAPAPTE